MRAVRRTRDVSSDLDGSLESLLSQFSATTLELNPSLGTSEFARRLTERTAQMLGARAAVLAVVRDSDWSIAGLSGPAQRWDAKVQQRLAAVLAEQATVPASDLRTGSVAVLFGREMADALGWGEAVLAPLRGSENELLGVLCLVDLRRMTETDRQLLGALASHASVALENVRLFSRIERSRKQWVQDFDAITDFIVVHDHEGRVLRLNRALANLLGMPPSEAVGRDIGKMELLASAAQPGRCPFCRNTRAALDEFVHPAGDSTYLVSTSRIHAGAEDEGRTIHVLKDITDRREAERRYRRERDFNRNILNNTQSMILVLDTVGLVSYANRRCFEAGYREPDLLGRPLVEMIPQARRPALAEALEKTLEGTAVDNLELPVF